MRSDADFGELAPSPDALTLSSMEVAKLAHCGPDLRWDEDIARGIAEVRGLMAPRSRWRRLTPQGADGLFAGGTPVEEIALKGESWLFVATIGPAVEARVREHFDAGRYLDGVILDAAGSAGVEALCDAVERECAVGADSSRFSPGYCMWALGCQRRLLALLESEEIGVRLLPSMLMHPLKSVSGVVVRACREDLAIPEGVCESCDARGCARRGTI
jgi:hypothetical protein